MDHVSRTPIGVRGLKLWLSGLLFRSYPSRTPIGVRGLKFIDMLPLFKNTWSHPNRGAWIEIYGRRKHPIREDLSHPNRGAWIEIVITIFGLTRLRRRTPIGVRGLKLYSWLAMENK